MTYSSETADLPPSETTVVPPYTDIQFNSGVSANDKSTGARAEPQKQAQSPLCFLMKWAFYYADPKDKHAFRVYLQQKDYTSAAAKMSHLIGQRYGFSVTEAFTFFQRHRLGTFEFLTTLNEINQSEPTFFNLKDKAKEQIKLMLEDETVKEKITKRSRAKLGKQAAFFTMLVFGGIALVSTIVLVLTVFSGPQQLAMDFAAINAVTKIALFAAFFAIVSSLVNRAFNSYHSYMNKQLTIELEREASTQREAYKFKLTKGNNQQQLKEQENRVHDIVKHHFDTNAHEIFYRALKKDNTSECHKLLRLQKPRVLSGDSSSLFFQPMNAQGWFFGDNTIKPKVFVNLRNAMMTTPATENSEDNHEVGNTDQYNKSPAPQDSLDDNGPPAKGTTVGRTSAVDAVDSGEQFIAALPQ